MDEMIIKSDFMRGIITKILRKALKKKLSIDANIDVKDIHVVFDEDNANIHLELDANMSKSDLMGLLIRNKIL